MKYLSIAALLVLCAVTGVVSATDAAPASSSDPKADVRRTIQSCAQGLERVLPGDYYFCAAARNLGHGHSAAARERLRDAAYWASKPAQYVLGLMYFSGDEGPKNRPLGIAWLALADERHDPRFEPAFVQAYREATPAEREAANTYWLTLKQDYSDAVAGRRARHRYNDEMRNIEAAAMFGGSIFIDGLTPGDGPGFGQFGNGVTSRVSGEHGFAISRSLNKAGEVFFRGMAGSVTVGEATPTNLVPIGQLAAGKAPAAD